MRMKALLPVLASLGLFVALPATVASADGPALPTCNQLLQGPPKEVSANKVIDSAKVNADRSVTTVVTVSWSFAVSSKNGEKIFDCVWDGTPGEASVVGSTGHPGADCSPQGLSCTFTVTTQPLAPGPHRLCDIAMILGTGPMPQTIAGPAPSGSRTPACVDVNVPPPPSSPPPPPPSSPPTDGHVLLASTGGLDYRFVLVGLTVLVAGLVLLVVTVSGRSVNPFKRSQ
jgi:hypothetical protein